MPSVDIRADHLAIVQEILQQQVPEAEVWVFGSRAKWLARDTSDLDLCLRAEAPLSFERMGLLAEAFENSNLPYKVDLVDWAALSDSFRQIIERDKVALQADKLSTVAAINPPRKVKKGELVPFIEMAALPLSGRDISKQDIEIRVAKAAGAHFRNGDTLLARITPCLENGKTAQVNVLGDGQIGEGSTEFIVLCGQEPADNDFVYYLCRDQKFRDYAISRMEGTSGRQRVSWQAIADYSLHLPKPEERRMAAQVLASLDDRIENLRQSNATLEAIAAALFKSWFVDFDGVAPEDMQESELGLIPKGWRVTSLDSIATYLNGLALQKFPAKSQWEFLPVIKIAQLRAGNTDGADKASVEIKPEYIVEDGDVLFSWSGSLEVEVWAGGRGALNQHLFKLTSDVVPKWFYYFATRLHLAEFRAIAAGKATTMGHIQRKHLTEAKIALPPPEALKSFDSRIAPLFEKRIANAVNAKVLGQLRDLLLPRLISGQLRISEAERIAEEAA